MSKQAKWAILLLVGAVAIAAIMIALRPQPEEQDVVASAPLVQTAAYEVVSGAIEIAGSGTVQPREEATLGAEVAGKLVYVNPAFQEGGRVASGAVLFRIDPSDYNNRVRSARADIAAQEVAVLQAEEEMAIAEAELERFARRQSSREALSRSIDSNDYAARILPPDGLRVPAPAGGAEREEPNVLATREPQLRSAEAARERAQAQLADARLALSRTVVRAPFAGIVRSESVSVGTLVQPGQSLGTLVASSSYEVRISLTEAEAALVPALFAAGSTRVPAQVMLEYGDATWRWNAYVDRVDPILDPETRTIDVFLRVSDPMNGGVPVTSGDGAGNPGSGPPLLLGSFVNATINGSSERPHARIPIAALQSDDRVWVLRGGKLAIVPVDVLQRTDDFAWVAGAGLGRAGNVVTSPLRTPVDGMPLRTQSENETEGQTR